MAQKVSGLTLVLKLVRTGESDMVVHLLSREHGRMTAIAKGGRKSFRRFGGALEIGTRLNAQLSVKANRDLHLLDSATVVGPVKAVRSDLERIHQMAYALELARLTARPGQADEEAYDLIVGFIEGLEWATATPASLLAWEMALMRHLGYGLRLGSHCVISDEPADGLSLEAGGVVSVRHARVSDALRLPPSALAALTATARGEILEVAPGDVHALRTSMSRIWQQITGHGLKTAAFLFST